VINKKVGLFTLSFIKRHKLDGIEVNGPRTPGSPLILSILSSSKVEDGKLIISSSLTLDPDPHRNIKALNSFVLVHNVIVVGTLLCTISN
jgi:hypothetical protein